MHSRPLDRLLPRLAGVREIGPGRHIALCPAHDDRSPSLNVRETGDGTLLIKCWAGCGAADVVQAAGLELRDLFPQKPQDRRPIPKSQRWVPRDVLAAVAHEATVVALCAEAITRGDPLADSDMDRLLVAAGRLHAAAGEVSA